MEENLLEDCKDELDNLLNLSIISAPPDSHPYDTSFGEFSICRDKLNLSEKQRTREESYEDIMKQIHQAKLERIELAKQMHSLKSGLVNSYLKPFHQEFSELNQQNIALRQQLRKCDEGKEGRKEGKEWDRNSNRSSIRLKASVKSSYGDENKKTNAKPRRNHVSPNSLLKKDAKLAESTTNLGRSQIQSPNKSHRKRESQLTERKADDNTAGVSVNISVLDENNYHIRQSLSSQQLPQHPQDRNIFLQFLEGILEEEKQFQNNKMAPLQECLSLPDTNPSQEVLLVNQLQEEVREANQKLEMLSLVVGKYQKEIGQLNIGLKAATEWTDKLWQVKGRYIQMQQKCTLFSSLSRQVAQKEDRLRQLKQAEMMGEQQKAIPSIQTMIKLLCPSASLPHDSSKRYLSYYKQIREVLRLQKQDQNRRGSRVVKVKEAIDSIREGRKKFNELIHIYQSRIGKLQEKISKVKTPNQRR